MEHIDGVLSAEEKAILVEQRKRVSSDTQALIKIIDRLSRQVEDWARSELAYSSCERVLRNVKAE